MTTPRPPLALKPYIDAVERLCTALPKTVVRSGP
jgi:hypothetical protein